MLASIPMLASILFIVGVIAGFVLGCLLGFTAGHDQGTRDAGVFRERK